MSGTRQEPPGAALIRESEWSWSEGVALICEKKDCWENCESDVSGRAPLQREAGEEIATEEPP
tara:strand:+ start:243 stop:431 length:189 start_codon:yes stop_codon:yes gene_type:complete